MEGTESVYKNLNGFPCFSEYATTANIWNSWLPSPPFKLHVIIVYKVIKKDLFNTL